MRVDARAVKALRETEYARILHLNKLLRAGNALLHYCGLGWSTAMVHSRLVERTPAEERTPADRLPP